jgi:hypothetical protein
MKECDVNEKKLINGDYCRKGSPYCFCAVGFPYERLCDDCKDLEDGFSNQRTSMCVCPPKEYCGICSHKIDECACVDYGRR